MIVGAGALLVVGGCAAIAGKAVHDATRGRRLHDAAGDMFDALNHDSDSVISLRDATRGHENLRVEDNACTEDDGLLCEEYSIYDETAKLRKADADGDGLVSRADLVNLLASYDASGNGRINLRESLRLERELPRRHVDDVNWSRNLPKWAQDEL